MKIPVYEVPSGNQYFAGIKFHEFCEFRLIWRKMVPAKIINKQPIREIQEI